MYIKSSNYTQTDEFNCKECNSTFYGRDAIHRVCQNYRGKIRKKARIYIINNSTNKHFNNSTIITIFANYYLKKRNFVFMSSLVKDFENVECFF